MMQLDRRIQFTILSLFHNRYVCFAESLGPSVIKSYLKKVFGGGIDVDIIDMQFGASVDDVLKRLAAEPPDIVGLSAKVLTLAQMMEILDKRNLYDGFRKKGTLFVAGNISASCCYREIIEKHHDVFVVIGEGELACADLVLYAAGRKPLEEVSNTAYFRRADNRVYVNPARKVVTFSELAPPDRGNAMLTLARGGTVYVEGSRGCSWARCSFCSLWCAQHKQWRRKPTDLLIAELEALRAMGAERFEFTDSDFFGPNPRTPDDLAMHREFARQKIHLGNSMAFFAYIRVHSVFREADTVDIRREKCETLKLLKEAGLRKVYIGVDGAADAQRARFCKGTSGREAREAVRILEEIGFEKITVGMIVLDPFMSLGELQEGMNFVRDSKLDKHIYFAFARVSFYEGTPATEAAKREGIVSSVRDIALSYRPEVFLDQRVGRVARIFDCWHRDNKPLIFGLQELSREGKADPLTRRRLAESLDVIRGQYYALLQDMVSNYAERGVEGLLQIVAEHLLSRAACLKRISETLATWPEETLCRELFRLAAESYVSDTLAVRVLAEGGIGRYLDWGRYRPFIAREFGIPSDWTEKILAKTLARVQEHVSFRNPRLHIPNPPIEAVREQVAEKWRRIVCGAAALLGTATDSVEDRFTSLASTDTGLRLLWAFQRRLHGSDRKGQVDLLKQLGFDLAVRYMLLLSWEIECGNDDLRFVDAYAGQTVKDVPGLRRAISFCFAELNVCKRSSIQAKKLFFMVQNDEFDIDQMPRVDAVARGGFGREEFDKDGRLASLDLAVAEIGLLEVNKRVFNPILKYQMTGLLARAMPDVAGKSVLDVGCGTGILGILSALRGARKAVLVDVSQRACECSRRNAKAYGVSQRLDVRHVPEGSQGRFREVLKEDERFDIIMSNPPWGEGSMVGPLGKAFSDPGKSFLQYLLETAAGFLRPEGEVVLGYSSRNDYGENTLLDFVDSFRGVEYQFRVIGSLFFPRPLYPELFYAVSLRPVRSK